MKKIQAQYQVVANKVEWSKPDKDGRIESTVGNLESEIWPEKNKFVWTIWDIKKDESVDSGNESTLENAKKYVEENYLSPRKSGSEERWLYSDL